MRLGVSALRVLSIDLAFKTCSRAPTLFYPRTSLNQREPSRIYQNLGALSQDWKHLQMLWIRLVLRLQLLLSQF